MMHTMRHFRVVRSRQSLAYTRLAAPPLNMAASGGAVAAGPTTTPQTDDRNPTVVVRDITAQRTLEQIRDITGQSISSIQAVLEAHEEVCTRILITTGKTRINSMIDAHISSYAFSGGYQLGSAWVPPSQTGSQLIIRSKPTRTFKSKVKARWARKQRNAQAAAEASHAANPQQRHRYGATDAPPHSMRNSSGTDSCRDTAHTPNA